MNEQKVISISELRARFDFFERDQWITFQDYIDEMQHVLHIVSDEEYKENYT